MALFDLRFTVAADYLTGFSRPWLALDGLEEFLRTFGERAGGDYEEREECVWVHRSASVASSAVLGKYTVIGAETQVRQGAFLRGCVLIGKHCVIGNSTEVKQSVLFDGVQAPHFNYIGDSVLGRNVHFGAGAVTSNVKSDKSPIFVTWEGVRQACGRRKFGAIVGDCSEIGCNSVLNPGTVVGRNTTVYPLSCVRGTVPPDSIYKRDGAIVAKR